MHFPEKNILLYDSGKLVKMVGLLKMIKHRGEKVLIFTQMTKMLDIFEKIMNMNKFNYVRLDGGTKT
jgi:helicase SWR1